MSRHIKKKKFHFTALSLVLLFVIAGSVETFRHVDAKSIDRIVRTFEYQHALANGPVPVLRRPVSAAGIPVLAYHGIVAPADRFTHTPETFRDQLFALKRAGYETITLREFESFIHGQTELPDGSFLLTFDDGRIDSFFGADPILKALDYTAVMFIATEASVLAPDVTKKKSTYYLSQDHVQEMLDTGRWEIGSHAKQETGGVVPIDAEGTKGNFLSSKMWLADVGRLENDEEFDARVGRELGDSRKAIEAAFNVKVDAFSYPFGDYGHQAGNAPDAETTVSKHVAANYTFAFRQVWRNDGMYTLNYPGDDLYFLKRFETPTSWDGARLVSFLNGVADKPLPYYSSVIGTAGWKGAWGEVTTDYRTVSLNAPETGTGAIAFLEGSNTWHNYEYAADIVWVKGSRVALLARYQGPDDYLSCTIGDDYIRIDRTVDGKMTRVAESENTAHTRIHHLTVTLHVHDGSIVCGVRGIAAVAGTVPDETGGVGLKIWDPIPANASIKVSGMRAKNDW